MLPTYLPTPIPRAALTRLESTLADSLVTVDYKALAESLSHLESTLTKNRGEGLGRFDADFFVI